MKRLSVTLSILLLCSVAYAGRITGTVTDSSGRALSYASVLVKGTPVGTSANDAGNYALELEPGTYVLVCQYVGYERAEKEITVTDAGQTLHFVLHLQQTTMNAVVIRPGGEDPAYEIIRQAIKKRKYYLEQVAEFRCQVYMKGQLQLRGFPKRLFGQKVDFGDGDTSRLKILYLAETVSTYSVEKPDKVKIEVSSTRVSGQRDAFGLSQPQIFSFYDNNIQIGRNLNPRGFVSPIADNALAYYGYKLEGVFTEDGREINHIRVFPLRRYDPVFSGHIQITDGDWRIHSLQLELRQESQMDLIDTLRIEQLYVPLNKEVWVIKSQVIYPAIRFMGFDGYGSFVNVYSNFELNPSFRKGYFDNVYLKYQEGSNKRSRAHWDSVRPVPLRPEELADYRRKDSLERIQRSPRYLDSVERRNNRLSLGGLLASGQAFTRESKKASYSYLPLIDAVNYNTFEGWVVNLSGSYTRRLDSNRLRRSAVTLTPNLRYGFSNRHFNAGMLTTYTYGNSYASSVSMAAGKGVFQFNKQSPFTERNNTINTLLFEKNFLKTYEAWFARLNYNQGIGEGLVLRTSIEYEDRMPLENTSSFTLRNVKHRQFTPNYPVELLTSNIRRHQAFVTSVAISWQPGSRYLEFPGRKEKLGSVYPAFELAYMKGIENILGSDVNFDKWRLTITDDISFDLKGALGYRFSVGGFLYAGKTEAPDFQHFNGNQSIFAGSYLNSFQLAPFYQNSTTASFFTTLHAEHHFNGLLTNRIPLLNRLNWHLVAGVNAFYVNPRNNYFEYFAGIENILRFLRIDLVQSYSRGSFPFAGIRIGLSGALFGRAVDR